MDYKEVYNKYLSKINGVKTDTKNFISDKYNDYIDSHPYEEMSNLNPIKPLAIWSTTNKRLDNFYNRPEINITNSQDDKNIKNTMRHIVGLANTMQQYKNPYIANLMGGVKEFGDIILLNLDNGLDWKNNQIGINYATQNPNFTNEDILNYAYGQAIKNYKDDYGYSHPRFEKEVYGTIINPKN